MSITQRRPGVWRVRVYTGYNRNTGRRQLRSIDVHGSRYDAQRIEVQLRDGTYDELAGRRDFDHAGDEERAVLDIVNAVIDHLAVIGRAPKTVTGYRSIARSITSDPISELPIRSLRARDIDRYYARLIAEGKTPARIRKYHSLLRTTAGWAVRWEMADRNVVRDATPPTVHARRVISPDTAVVARVLMQVDASDPSGVRGVAMRLLGMLGCRRGEVCALRWSDVDLDSGRVHIHASRDDTPGAPAIKATKTHQDRWVHLDASSADWLRAHKRVMQERAIAVGARWTKTAFVLSDHPGSTESLRPDVITKAWERARKRAGVTGVRLMDLRHWAATQLIDSGLDPVVVAGVLGHADPSTTRRFYAASTDRGRDQAGVVLGTLLAELG